MTWKVETRRFIQHLKTLLRRQFPYVTIGLEAQRGWQILKNKHKSCVLILQHAIHWHFWHQ